jgi:hypothetical protein
LECPASAVRVDIEESLFQHIEKGVKLGLVVLTALILLAKVANHVSTDLNQGTSKSV